MKRYTWLWIVLAVLGVAGIGVIAFLWLRPGEGARGGITEFQSARERTIFVPSGKPLKSATIGKDGGSIDLGWVEIKFPHNIFNEKANVEVYETSTSPRNGIIIASTPIRITLAKTSGKPGSPLKADARYTCTFHLDKLPPSGGNFNPSNKYIDVLLEWNEPGRGTVAGPAWADHDDSTIEVNVDRDDITLALIDYSRFTELTSVPHFTRNPRDFIDFIYRRIAKSQFNPANEGPLGNRIPVILVHGMNILSLKENAAFSDTDVSESKDIWQPFIDVLNYSDWVFSEFKFFWFEYPSGDPVFGEDGNGARLKRQVEAWAKDNEPELVNRPVVIIAHSMGGLVARDYMENEGGNVFKLITICTPHYGTPLANLAQSGLGWFADYLSEGLKDIACNEPIQYNGIAGTEYTTALNPGLGLLDANMPEGDPRLICYGATSEGPAPNDPLDPFDKVTLDTLKKVTGPTWLMETSDGYRSDGEVPWRSQLYCRKGPFPGPEFKRVSRTKYHRTVFQDFDLIINLYKDLLDISKEYRAQVSGG